MIKLIVFDLVGVLVRENDFELTSEEQGIERLFGQNGNDADFLKEARTLISNDALLVRTIEYIIDNIYEVREKNLFRTIKESYPDMKIVIATNHVSFVRNFIGETFGIDYLDDVFISAELNMMKPSSEFYEHILNKFDIDPAEMLFLDDSKDNIEGATKLNINTTKVEKDTLVLSSVLEFLSNY